MGSLNCTLDRSQYTATKTGKPQICSNLEKLTQPFYLLFSGKVGVSGWDLYGSYFFLVQVHMCVGA